MPDGAVVTFAPSVFERDNLLVLAMLDDLGSDLRAFNGTTVRNLVAVSEQKHVVKRSGFASLNIQKIDVDRVAFCDAILSSTGSDDCVSHKAIVPVWGKSRAKFHESEGLTSGKLAALLQPVNETCRRSAARFLLWADVPGNVPAIQSHYRGGIPQTSWLARERHRFVGLAKSQRKPPAF